MIKKFIFSFLIAISSFKVIAQQHSEKIDSLQQALLTAADTSKVLILNLLSKEYMGDQTQYFLNYSMQAKKLAEKINYEKGLALSLCTIGAYYANRGQYKIAKANYDQSMALCRKLKLKTLYDNLLVNYGILYASSGEYKTARRYYDTVITHATENKDYKLLSQTLDKIGIIFSDLGIYDSALVYELKAVKLAEQIKDSVLLGKALTNLGRVEWIRYGYDKSIEYNSKALDIGIKINDKDIQSYALTNLGSVYSEQKEHQKGIDHFLKALVIANELQYQSLITLLYNNLAATYQDMGDNDKAYEYYKYGYELALKVNNKRQIIMYLNNLGLVLKEKKEYAKAISYLEKALKENKNNEILEEASDTYLSLAQAYSGMNDFKKAYQYQVLYSSVDSTIFSKEREQAVSEATTKYNIEKKTRELLVSQKNNRIKDLQLSNNRMITIAVSVILLLTGIILFIYYKKFRIKKKSNEEKEILLKEIHHRVKNNMQIILSILNLQARKMNDEKVTDFVKEGESRIQSMAIIHEKLYQSDNLADISFKEYIHQLLVFIYQVYNVDKNKISYDIDAGDIQLDINTAVPVGLIINELICNALKHGFKEKESGSISIQLNKIQPKEYKLQVKDSGKGLPEDFDIKKSNTLGLKLIQTLIRQIDGSLEIASSKGSMFSIYFKEAI